MIRFEVKRVLSGRPLVSPAFCGAIRFVDRGNPDFYSDYNPVCSLHQGDIPARCQGGRFFPFFVCDRAQPRCIRSAGGLGYTHCGHLTSPLRTCRTFWMSDHLYLAQRSH